MRHHRLWQAHPFRVVIALVCLSALAVALVAPTAAQPATGPLLRLHRGSDGGRAGGDLAAATALQAVAAEVAIIQFAGPITIADRAALERSGAKILEYLPDFAYLVRGDAVELATAAALPGVYRRVPMLVADKFAPALLHALSAGTLAKTLRVNVLAWPGHERELAAALAEQGLDTRQPLSAAQLLMAAQLPELRWIEPAFAPRLLNDRAREIIGVPAVWEELGLYGAGQIVAVADSGLDTGVTETLSADFAGRIVATQVLSTGGSLADELGHGTHVTGTLAGSGALSGALPAEHRYNGSFAGVAPEASLVIQAFETNASGQVQGLGNDPYPIFARAYAEGARIHSDSWGGPTGVPFLDPEGYFGGYTTPAERTDAFVWEHPDMAIFFAAGNSGNDGDYALQFCLPNGDGWIDEDSLAAPGTAKNVITVGASESVRLQGNLTTLTWKDFDPTCYGREPLASDLLSDNANGMAAFSSRGPVDDGRVKPDLVAPGTSIVSSRSHHPSALSLWGEYSANPHYVVAGGTSMATPLVAGAAVLVREWLGRQGMANPSAAALKAMLLNTTTDIAPGQYVVAGRQEIPSARPNSVAGWGRTSLEFLRTPAPYQFWLDDHTAGLVSGELVRYTSSARRPLTVRSSAQSLRVMLVWTDPPASLSAARQLVNDLDLVVRGPNGQEYRGNGTATPDRVNNVEGVVIEQPQLGSYSIEVQAYNVPIRAQPFALVVSGHLEGESSIYRVALPFLAQP